MLIRYREAWVQRALDAAEAALADNRLDELCQALKPLPSELFMLLYFDRPERWPKLAAWLPNLPSAEDQARWTGNSGFATMRQACVFLEDVFSRFGRDSIDAKVLDYGCGWGRMLRLLYNRVKVSGIYGADPWQLSLDRMRETGVHASIAQVSHCPESLPFDVKFDLIYAYSVFTHIGPESQEAVLRALRRGIADDGLLALTIRQANFWEDTEWLDAAAREKLLDRHFAEGFVHHTIPASKVGLNEFGNTSISLDYIRREWTDWRLTDVQWRADSPYQTIVFLRAA